MLAVSLPAGAAVAQSCDSSPCTIAPANYGSPALISAIPSGGSLILTNQAQFSVVYVDSGYSFVLAPYSSGAAGASSSSSDGGAGQSTGSLTITNQGELGIMVNTPVPAGTVGLGLWSQTTGGQGGNYTNTDSSGLGSDVATHNAGAGGAAGAVSVTNSVFIGLSPALLGGGIGLAAAALGGAGGNVSTDGSQPTDPDTGLPNYDGNPGNGGNGGNAGAVTVTNSGTIQIGTPIARISGGFTAPAPEFAVEYIFPYVGFRGISATSVGGAAGTGAGTQGTQCDSSGAACGGGATGGSGGDVTVVNTGGVGIAWSWGKDPTSTPLPEYVGFGIIAATAGRDGTRTLSTDYNGGSGGSAGKASITLNQGGNVAVSVTATGPAFNSNHPLELPPLTGVGVAAFSFGGNGAQPYGASHPIGDNPIIAGGSGGSAGEAIISINGASVSVQGDQMAGAFSHSVGGQGGSGNFGTSGNFDYTLRGGSDANGGAGGASGVANIGIDNGTISTTGRFAPAAIVISTGGAGGVGANYFDNTGGDGGNGGPGGSAGNLLASWFKATVGTDGQGSPALIAITQGGNGGHGGDRPNGGSGDAGGGGNAGAGGAVTVQLQQSTLTTTQSDSPGVIAKSIGGQGGTGGTANSDAGASPRDGGAGGASGLITVTIDSASSITTAGDSSPAVIAASASGSGGNGTSDSNIISSHSGAGGAGGTVGPLVMTDGQWTGTAIQVTNDGRLTTAGAASIGIIAQAVSGGGGSGGTVGGIVTGGGSGASAGAIGDVVITQTGSISTSGQSAHGILAQSIGGGGGNGGALSFANSGIGGSSGLASAGGTVTITNTGSISTAGGGAIGVVAQSIGGGGGNGGDAEGLFSIGGQGGAGGNGGAVSFTQTNGAIQTSGQQSHGLVAQSLGGGGGNGGSATTVSVGASLAIGGTGGTAGDGGTTSVSLSGGSILAQGSKASGLVAQSVGGGGGTGGAAYSSVVSALFSAGVSLGGDGGAAGNGSQVTVDLSNVSIVSGQSQELVAPSFTATNRLPVDAFGIVAQSIGGGGGVGGSASANALAVAIPIPETNTNYGFSVAYAVGGTGGAGGSHTNATNVAVSLHGGTNVFTYGLGSHGVMAQSIGGGGGEGGDSSALAATIAYGRAATAAGADAQGTAISAAVGGDGGSGGSGGPVQVNLADATGSQASVTTLGDFANGLLAQSVGGGGGNGGLGASTSVFFGGTQTVTASVAVGGHGSSGGDGGTVQVGIAAPGLINTYGDGANAVVAQSIGGGGGTSQGSTINLGLSYQFGLPDDPKERLKTVQPTGTLTANIGSTGGAGGSGQAVTVTMAGTIATQGGDASGILAQSIGSGGGLGGGAGGQASADNPISAVSKLRTFGNNVIFKNVPATGSLSMNLGSDGVGTAGSGGPVSVTHSGSITTLGDWSTGIFAQSVGGGGGRGGVAMGSGVGPARIALSAGTINGGSGGTVTITLQGGNITTGEAGGSLIIPLGYAGFGIVGQSIGGGGGLVADNSDAANGTVLAPDGVTVQGSSINLGSLLTSGNAQRGNGGPVTLTGNGSIQTYGDGAHAVVLQSVGGGGGIGGTGTARFQTSQLGTGTVAVSVGGGAQTSGNGGDVTLNALLDIRTEGNNAYGVLAQSIGGGGGLGFIQQGVPASYVLGARTATQSNGGVVSLTLADGSTITTSGAGSAGILAQSVGGGGGIAGYGVGATTLQRATAANGPNVESYGFGETVNITTGNSTIITNGASAHGIVAQSVGGGGGIIASSDGTAVFAGVTGAGVFGSGGAVTVTQSGTIIATGLNATGILAQSVGSSGGGKVTIGVAGSVTGGTGQGYGIWVDGGTSQNALTVSDSGFVSALSGNGVNYSGGYGLAVTNNGVIEGDINGATAAQVMLANNGRWSPNLSSTATVVNNGRIVLGAAGGFRSPTIVGNFTQSATGTIVVNADFNTARSDRLTVQGDVVLAGSITPVATSILPNISLPVLSATGGITGGLSGVGSPVFGFGVARSGNQMLLSATSANFAPASFGLSQSRREVASHLQSIWDAGGTPALGSLFGLLGAAANAGPATYSAQLRQLSPDASVAPGARGLAGSTAFASNALSCPKFADTTAMLIEGRCAWMRVTGRTSTQDSGNGITNYNLNAVTWQIGGQTELAPGWLIGGSLAYESSRLGTTDSLTSGSGQAGYGAVTLKYQTGPWLFASAAFGGAGEFSLSRTITLPGFASVAKGSPGTANMGMLFRATYTIGEEDFYLRPSLTLSAVNVRTGAYQENGGGVLNLRVDAASQTTLIATPMLELGGRVPLSEDLLLRPFVTVGLSLLSNDSWRQSGALISAPNGAGAFSTTVLMDQAVGRVGVGAQLYTSRNIDFRLQYDGEFSRTVTSHAGSLVVSMPF